jgi:RNA polymerase sigma-70 factor, ECF subfamily
MDGQWFPRIYGPTHRRPHRVRNHRSRVFYSGRSQPSLLTIEIGCRREREGFVAVSQNNQRGVGHYVKVMTPLPTHVSGRFEDVVLPHLDAGYRLARWLSRNDQDAQDIVQEASLRAFQYFRTFAGQNGRAWFLRIVRNTSCSWRIRGAKVATDVFDEEQHSDTALTRDPETLLLHAASASLIDETLRNLPDRFRSLLVLREVDGLSYQELADVLEIPIGTVMSRLSRGRQALRRALEVEIKQPAGAPRS